MQPLEVSGAVRLIYKSLGVKELNKFRPPKLCNMQWCRWGLLRRGGGDEGTDLHNTKISCGFFRTGFFSSDRM